MPIDDRKKLVWMCRRGTRELDQITLYYLQNHYDDVDEKQQAAFKRLLQLSDPDLQDLLIYGYHSPDEDINALATFIRANYQY